MPEQTRDDQLTQEIKEALRLVARYEEALRRIARAESGVWGRIAHEALRGDDDG